jgi:HPt (histidine-containing phosphotransfer) domain-containing protein
MPMTEQERAQLRAQLDQMVRAFLAKLPSRIEELQAYLEELREGGTEIRESIEEFAHSMAGSAGVFGFLDIARQAQVVESGLRAGETNDAIAPAVEGLLHLLEQPPARQSQG